MIQDLLDLMILLKMLILIFNYTSIIWKDRPSLIVQSSGSTGKPKQIVHTEYNFNSVVQKMAYTDLPFIKETQCTFKFHLLSYMD